MLKNVVEFANVLHVKFEKRGRQEQEVQARRGMAGLPIGEVDVEGPLVRFLEEAYNGGDRSSSVAVCLRDVTEVWKVSNVGLDSLVRETCRLLRRCGGGHPTQGLMPFCVFVFLRHIQTDRQHTIPYFVCCFGGRLHDSQTILSDLHDLRDLRDGPEARGRLKHAPSSSSGGCRLNDRPAAASTSDADLLNVPRSDCKLGHRCRTR